MNALRVVVLLVSSLSLRNNRASLCFAFVVPVHPTTTTTPATRRLNTNGKPKTNYAASSLSTKTVAVSSQQRSTTALASLGVARNVATLPLVRRAFLTLVAAFAVVFRNRIFWPGAVPDKSVSEPLPPGGYGCPFVGHNVLASSADYGFGVFFTKLFKTLGRPKLFKFYGLGRPFVSVTGKGAIQEVIKREFSDGGVSMINLASFPNAVELFGKYSVLYENDKNRHAQLRRLVGVAMTPKALQQAVPLIQDAAEDQVERNILSKGGSAVARGDDSDSGAVTMFRVNNEFTLDIAWKQILGLDLETPEEIAEFHANVRAWMKCLMNPTLMTPFKLPWLKRTKGYKAKQYLVRLVEKKLEKLDRGGPDGSTLSNIYFATDEDGVTRLPRQVVMDNALILIVAGSETSSSTLTTAMLLLGLHKDAFRKLQQEQIAVVAKHGTTALTKDILDNDCPYLDAVVKETMRIRPIPQMEMRRTDSTMVIDGQQIPKKWSLWLNVRATHDQDPACRVDDSDDHMDIGRGFVPDRWFAAETRPVDYLPWGEGARRCLGERLAVTEMKVFLATVARKLESFDLVGVERPEDVRWKGFSATPYPKDGVVIRPVAAAASGTASNAEVTPSPDSAMNSTSVAA